MLVTHATTGCLRLKARHLSRQIYFHQNLLEFIELCSSSLGQLSFSVWNGVFAKTGRLDCFAKSNDPIAEVTAAQFACHAFTAREMRQYGFNCRIAGICWEAYPLWLPLAFFFVLIVLVKDALVPLTLQRRGLALGRLTSCIFVSERARCCLL